MTEQTRTPETATDAGYRRALKPRHVTMIAFGGAVGRFLGPVIALVAGWFAVRKRIDVRAFGEAGL